MYVTLCENGFITVDNHDLSCAQISIFRFEFAKECCHFPTNIDASVPLQSSAENGCSIALLTHAEAGRRDPHKNGYVDHSRQEFWNDLFYITFGKFAYTQENPAASKYGCGGICLFSVWIAFP